MKNLKSPFFCLTMFVCNNLYPVSNFLATISFLLPFVRPFLLFAVLLGCASAAPLRHCGWVHPASARHSKSIRQGRSWLSASKPWMIFARAISSMSCSPEQGLWQENNDNAHKHASGMSDEWQITRVYRDDIIA